jgi:photosystem II stability/assembly factor-like uncharacterized protein
MTRAAVLGVLAALALATPAHAGIDAWTVGDQPGGALSDVAVDGQYALVGVHGGGYGGTVLRSEDGGRSWQRVTQMDFRDVTDVAIDPAPGQPWYVATTTGLFRSLDHGQTWAEITGGIGVGASFSDVAVDRGRPGTAFFVRSDGKMFRSSTGGTGSWANVSAGAPVTGLSGLVVNPVSHRAWGYRYSNVDGGVYGLPDGQNTWTAVNFGLPDTLVQGLALDLSDNPRLLAATTQSVNWVPAETSQYIWSSINGGLPANPYTLSLTTDAAGDAYVLLIDHKIRRLPSNAGTWADVPTGGRPANYAERLTGDPATPGRVLALTAGGGLIAPNAGLGPLWRTEDSGSTWTRSAQGVRVVSVEDLAPDPRVAGRVLVATNDDAVQRSQDGGATWAPGASGLPGVQVEALTADGARPDVFYASEQGAGVLRSTDAGATWAPVGSGDPSSVYQLEAIPGRAGVVFSRSSPIPPSPAPSM